SCQRKKYSDYDEGEDPKELIDQPESEESHKEVQPQLSQWPHEVADPLGKL
ncbi:unnamed protein product, partial [marine sediment metagenome]